MSTSIRQLLDPAKVRSYRIAVGYPERVLSGILGVSNRVIDRIENGSDQSHLDLRFVIDLATALGCTPADLLLTHAPDDESCSGDPDVCADSDVAAIGALVAASPGDLHVDIAATALKWTRDRTLVALHHLAEHLARVGQRLSWLGDYSVRILPAETDPDAEAAAHRADLAINGVFRPNAQMIHQLIETGRPGRLGEWNAAWRNRLIAGGVIDFDKTAPTSSMLPIHLSAEARYALALDETGATG